MRPTSRCITYSILLCSFHLFEFLIQSDEALMLNSCEEKISPGYAFQLNMMLEIVRLFHLPWRSCLPKGKTYFWGKRECCFTLVPSTQQCISWSSYLFINMLSFKMYTKYRNFTLKYFIACQEEFYSDLLLHGDRHFQEVVWFDTDFSCLWSG